MRIIVHSIIYFFLSLNIPWKRHFWFLFFDDKKLNFFFLWSFACVIQTCKTAGRKAEEMGKQQFLVLPRGIAQGLPFLHRWRFLWLAGFFLNFFLWPFLSFWLAVFWIKKKKKGFWWLFLWFTFWKWVLPPGPCFTLRYYAGRNVNSHCYVNMHQPTLFCWIVQYF